MTYPERCKIFTLKSKGKSIAQIAATLSVSRWTVHRELRRNQENGWYHYDRAHMQALERRSKGSSRPRKMTPALIVLIEGRLRQQWSPEQISGREVDPISWTTF